MVQEQPRLCCLNDDVNDSTQSTSSGVHLQSLHLLSQVPQSCCGRLTCDYCAQTVAVRRWMMSVKTCRGTRAMVCVYHTTLRVVKICNNSVIIA